MNSKVVVITGSSQGIGKAIGIQFLHAGYRIVINSRSAARLAKTEKELSKIGSVFAVQADVGSYDDCQRLVEATIRRYGRIDVLINNAGMSMEGELSGMNPDVFEQVVRVNLLGSANMSNAALREIRRSEGQILYISSLAGLLGLPGYSAYSASKMALTALAQSLRGELQGEGINVGIAYLGFTENDSEKKILSPSGESIPQPARGFIKAAPVQWAAGKVFNMVERRQKSAIIGPPGKIAAWAVWMFPQLTQWYARQKYRQHILKNQHADTPANSSKAVSDAGGNVGTSPAASTS